MEVEKRLLTYELKRLQARGQPESIQKLIKIKGTPSKQRHGTGWNSQNLRIIITHKGCKHAMEI